MENYKKYFVKNDRFLLVVLLTGLLLLVGCTSSPHDNSLLADNDKIPYELLSTTLTVFA